MSWTELKDKIYYQDGSFRDVYILATKRSDWEKWVGHINENYHIEWYNGKTNRTEGRVGFSVIKEYWDGNSDLCSTAKIFIGNIQLNAHFFTENEIENDIDPREFRSIEDHEKLIKFMADISNLLGKEVILTPENEQNTPLIKLCKEKAEYM